MKVLLFLTLLFTCIPGPNAWATDISAKDSDKRFILTGGAIAYTMNGDFSSTKEGRPEIKVDLDDLDLDENKLTYFLGASLRLSERWRLNLDCFSYHDKSSTTVDKSF